MIRKISENRFLDIGEMPEEPNIDASKVGRLTSNTKLSKEFNDLLIMI